MTNNETTAIIVFSDGQTYETITPNDGALLLFPTEESLDEVFNDEIDAVDAKTVRPDIRLDLKNLNEMMNAKGEIDVLRKAGYFQDGEDALSLLAGVDSLKMDLESATKFANACAASADAMTKKIADLESKVAVLESRIRSMGGSV